MEEWFTDRARESGLDFVHFNGMTGRFHFPEVIPPGVALLDYDDDGDLDVFVVQGQMLGKQPLSEALNQPQVPLKSRLYRNDLAVHADRAGTLRFTDVTDASGIVVHGYAMGAATGDFNNDGCVDLYVTNLERSQLFRNDCDGTFTDVSRESGAENRGWSVSASFVDYDRDGWLDLFVGNYVYYSVEADKPCLHSIGSLVDYCPPSVYRPQPDHLYHNNRDGTFTDVTTAAGMGREFGPALGVSTADFNGDGWVDIYVANDGAPNQLWINRHDGTFTNTALLAGAALGADGEAKGSMGVDAADFDHDGDEDLFVTELAREGHDLYVNDGIRRLRGTGRQCGHQAFKPAVHGLRRGLVRFRQRWLAGHHDRQRSGPAYGRRAHAERNVRTAAAQAAVPKSRQRTIRGRHRARPARPCAHPRSVAARRLATWTTMATRMSSWQMTTDQSGC